jgi:hypothetical protein
MVTPSLFYAIALALLTAKILFRMLQRGKCVQVEKAADAVTVEEAVVLLLNSVMQTIVVVTCKKCVSARHLVMTELHLRPQIILHNFLLYGTFEKRRSFVLLSRLQRLVLF